MCVDAAELKVSIRWKLARHTVGCFFVYFVRFLFFFAPHCSWQDGLEKSETLDSIGAAPLKHTIPHTHTAAAATSGSDSIKTKE